MSGQLLSWMFAMNLRASGAVLYDMQIMLDLMFLECLPDEQDVSGVVFG